jgi:hypothetical protein
VNIVFVVADTLSIAKAIIRKQMPGFRVVSVPELEVGYTAGKPDTRKGSPADVSTDLKKLKAKYGFANRLKRTRRIRRVPNDQVLALVEPDSANRGDVHMAPKAVIISLKKKAIVGTQG